MTINNLTSSSYADGKALSAYQGYVLNNKITTLEGNFNTALTNLYNACVDKGSTPTSQTISAIVTAVRNIDTSGGLDDWGLTLEDIENGFESQTQGFVAWTNSNSVSKQLASVTVSNVGLTYLAIPDTHGGLKVML